MYDEFVEQAERLVREDPNLELVIHQSEMPNGMYAELIIDKYTYMSGYSVNAKFDNLEITSIASVCGKIEFYRIDNAIHIPELNLKMTDVEKMDIEIKKEEI